MVNSFGLYEVAILRYKEIFVKEIEVHWNPSPANTSAASKHRRGSTARDQVPVARVFLTGSRLFTSKKVEKNSNKSTCRRGNRAEKTASVLFSCPEQPMTLFLAQVRPSTFHTPSPCGFWAPDAFIDSRSNRKSREFWAILRLYSRQASTGVKKALVPELNGLFRSFVATLGYSGFWWSLNFIPKHMQAKVIPSSCKPNVLRSFSVQRFCLLQIPFSSKTNRMKILESCLFNHNRNN